MGEGGKGGAPSSPPLTLALSPEGRGKLRRKLSGDPTLRGFCVVENPRNSTLQGRRKLMNVVTRRRFLGGAAATAAGAAMGPWVLRAHAQSGPLKVGLVLPYTGAYAVLGESITQGMELVF